MIPIIITAIVSALLPAMLPHIISLLIVWPWAGKAAAKQYSCNHLLVSDTKLSVWMGGSAKEYASSRVGRHAIEGNWYALQAEKLIDWLLGAGHCRKYIEPLDHSTGEIL